MASDKVRELISRTIEDLEALVGTESSEIFIDVPADSPRYIQVIEGDTVQEGDVRSETGPELESPSLREWTIERIGRKTVVGTDQETGERHEWDRESLEKKLTIGEYSTTLRDFDRVDITGEPKKSDHEGRSDEETVTVVLYGNDGRQFTRTYRLIGDEPGGKRRVELIEPDTQVESFEPPLREQFDRAIEHALRNEGYVR